MLPSYGLIGENCPFSASASVFPMLVLMLMLGFSPTSTVGSVAL